MDQYSRLNKTDS